MFTVDKEAEGVRLQHQQGKPETEATHESNDDDPADATANDRRKRDTNITREQDQKEKEIPEVVREQDPANFYDDEGATKPDYRVYKTEADGTTTADEEAETQHARSEDAHANNTESPCRSNTRKNNTVRAMRQHWEIPNVTARARRKRGRST